MYENMEPRPRTSGGEKVEIPLMMALEVFHAVKSIEGSEKENRESRRPPLSHILAEMISNQYSSSIYKNRDLESRIEMGMQENSRLDKNLYEFKEKYFASERMVNTLQRELEREKLSTSPEEDGRVEV